MMNRKHFRRFQKPTFKCQLCDRMTRDTGQGVDHLCEPCFEICGYDNMVNDNGYTLGVDDHGALEECNRYLAIIEKKGGNVEKVKRNNAYIWPR